MEIVIFMVVQHDDRMIEGNFSFAGETNNLLVTGSHISNKEGDDLN